MAKTISSGTSSVNIPPQLVDYYNSIFGGLTGAQATFPTIGQLPGAAPELQVPGVTPEQQALINQMVQQGSNSPQLAAAQQQLQQLTAGPIGSSPATQAGMQAFRDLAAPSIMGTAALQGNAAGGGVLSAMSRGAEQAAVPLIQQEISNREAAVGQYQNLAQSQIQSLAAAFEAAGYPREVALQQAMAQFQKAQQGFGIQENVALGLPGQFMLGTNTYGQQHQTKTAEDWINQGIGALAGIAGGFGF